MFKKYLSDLLCSVLRKKRTTLETKIDKKRRRKRINNYVKHFEYTEKDISEGKYSVEDLIDPFWCSVNIYDGLEKYNKDLSELTIAQRRFLALLWYDSEVRNGGHDQFFFNSTGIVWKDALEGMRMIGDDADADNFQKAIDLFGSSVPFDREERIQSLDKIGEIDAFEEIDEIYYDGEGFYKLMVKYIKEHPSEFVVNGDYPYFSLE